MVKKKAETPYDYNRATMEKVLNRIKIVESGCWEWLGCKGTRGYGEVTFHRKHRMVHRLVWEHLIGPIPDGFVLDHLCRNPACCNVAHLEPVTPAENVRRGNSGEHQRLKTHCPKGHPYDNTFVYKSGERAGKTHRRCRTCLNEGGRRYKARKKEKADE